MAFDRQQFMKQRHKVAKLQREYFKEEFPKKDLPSYSEFLKNDSPIREEIIAYEVSYQLNYQGITDDMFIDNSQTFYVYGLKGMEKEIEERSMNALLDSKGENNSMHFNRGTLEMLETKKPVNITPRGMEQAPKKKINDKELRQVIENKIAFDHIPNKIKFTNRKNREGEMKLDITHFV